MGSSQATGERSGSLERSEPQSQIPCLEKLPHGGEGKDSVSPTSTDGSICDSSCSLQGFPDSPAVCSSRVLSRSRRTLRTGHPVTSSPCVAASAGAQRGVILLLMRRRHSCFVMSFCVSSASTCACLLGGTPR